MDDGGEVKQDTVEGVEDVVSLGLSVPTVSKEELDNARENLSETAGGNGLGLPRVDLKE